MHRLRPRAPSLRSVALLALVAACQPQSGPGPRKEARANGSTATSTALADTPAPTNPPAPSAATPTTTPNPPKADAAQAAAPGAASPKVPGVDIVEAALQKPRFDLADSRRRAIEGQAGVVACVEAQASAVGVALLEAGGNAVDAAVGVALALSVTHPSAGNLGGGGFLLVKMGNRVEALDFREVAPARLDAANFAAMIAQGGKGPRSVGVPGTVRGLTMAHARHGRLPWARVVEPALRLAREGYVVGRRQALTLRWAQADLTANAAARRTFLPAGRPPQAGSRLDNPGLAVALERLKDQGADGFYEGETAEDLVRSLGEQGLLSLEDLRTYQAHWRMPLALDFYGAHVVTMPPPSGGGIVLAQSLLQLQALDVARLAKGSASRLHEMAEVSRRAQLERRLFVVDPDRLSPAQLDEHSARWLDPNTWLARAPIDPKHATPSASLDPSFAAAQRELEHTTHLGVLDRDGNAVSCTVTLSASFGSRVVSDKTGIVLNNAAASFGTTGENLPAGGRRTISSMAPTLLFVKGRGFLALGTPGGDTIPSTLTQLIVSLTVDGLDLATAVDAPRFHQGFVPDEIGTERGAPLPAAVVAGLRALGHRVTASRAAQGDVHAVALLDGHGLAYSDTREGGKSLAASP